MRYFLHHLRTPSGIERAFAPMPFADVESAYLDACAAIPETAADLLRASRDPMCCAYLICDADDRLLEEVPFADVLRPAAVNPGARPRPHRTGASPVVQATHRLLAQSSLACQRARELCAASGSLIAEHRMLTDAALETLTRARASSGRARLPTD